MISLGKFTTLILASVLPALSPVHAQEATPAAGGPSPAPMEESINLVFPPDPEAQKEKARILAALKRVPAADGENPEGENDRQPNIVLLLADDLGYSESGIYGAADIPTPHIDALAEEGMRWTDAYVTAAICSPSRAGILTGRYQQRFGFEFNIGDGEVVHRDHRGLDPAAITMADVLQQAGYATGIFGKWHLGTQEHLQPQARGFDEFYGFLSAQHSSFPVKSEQPVYKTILQGRSPVIEPDYLPDAIAREAVKFITAHHDKPFFAYVPFNAPHKPIQATQKYLDRFPDVKDQEQREYYAMISALDDAVGSIVTSLAGHDLTGKTLVIFLNDNGGTYFRGTKGNEPLRMGKIFLFEGGVRVPMIMKWPGNVPAGSVFSGLTSSLDIFPTVCAAAGIQLPGDLVLDGVDLMPFVEGTKQGSPHEILFWGNGPNMAVRKGSWKLIKSHDNAWLFDLSRDPGERKNLAKERPDKVAELDGELARWKSRMAEPAWPSRPKHAKILIDGLEYELNN